MHFYPINEEICKNLPVRSNDYINISTYYRILLPTILPDTIDTVLYLDGDMLCVDSLSELWELDLHNYAAAVVPDIHYANRQEFARLGLASTEGYFNAGCMFINLQYWREHNIQTKLLSFIHENPERCLKHDQDALNYVLHGALLYISTRYNFQRIMYASYFNTAEQLKVDVEKNAYTPCIIHYCDREKPWHKECFHPLKDVWLFVAKKTVSHLTLSYSYVGIQKIKWLIKSMLVHLHILPAFSVEYRCDFLALQKRLMERFR